MKGVYLVDKGRRLILDRIYTIISTEMKNYTIYLKNELMNFATFLFLSMLLHFFSVLSIVINFKM